MPSLATLPKSSSHPLLKVQRKASCKEQFWNQQTLTLCEWNCFPLAKGTNPMLFFLPYLVIKDKFSVPCSLTVYTLFSMYPFRKKNDQLFHTFQHRSVILQKCKMDHKYTVLLITEGGPSGSWCHDSYNMVKRRTAATQDGNGKLSCLSFWFWSYAVCLIKYTNLG